MKADLAAALLARAGDRCECGCGIPFGPFLSAERVMDHFAGRARIEDSLDSIWVLRRDCDALKTANKPSAAHWLRLWLAHCEKHNYRASYERAFKRLQWVKAKAVLGEAL
jgi:hypothetical protein